MNRGFTGGAEDTDLVDGTVKRTFGTLKPLKAGVILPVLYLPLYFVSLKLFNLT